MARRDGKVENQHYVPRMLLRRFAIPKRNGEPRTYVFDKREERLFETNIKNVVSERGFYKFSHEGKTSIVEEILSDLESKTDSAFRKLFEHKNLTSLTDTERGWIGIFLASQHLRVRHFRETISDLADKIVTKFEATNKAGPFTEGLRALKDDEEVKKFAIYFFAQSLPDLSSLMHEKKWILMEASQAYPLWISDNPVVMHNDQDRSNIGLALPGIQIYLPLSATLTLGLWCPDFFEHFVSSLRAAKADRQSLLVARALGASPDVAKIDNALEKMSGPICRLEKLVNTIESGEALKCSRENVIFLNSLQVRWAERYVMSNRKDFALAKRMLRDNPDNRTGPRMVLY